MIIHLVRHGKTPGNEKKRYIGVTDEALSQTGLYELEQMSYPGAEVLVVSPMLRCLQTARVICEKTGMDFEKRKEVSGFRECDFGDFEGKNYLELNGNADYQRWIDSGGMLPFPNGESGEGFRARVVDAFLQVLPELVSYKEALFVIHGGTIMALLEQFEPKHSYYDWQCKNGCGYTVSWEENKMELVGKIE